MRLGWTTLAAAITACVLAAPPSASAQNHSRSGAHVEPFVEDTYGASSGAGGELIDYRAAFVPAWQQKPPTKRATRPVRQAQYQQPQQYAGRQVSYDDPQDGEIIYEGDFGPGGPPPYNPRQQGPSYGPSYGHGPAGCTDCGMHGGAGHCADGCCDDWSGGCGLGIGPCGGCGVCTRPFFSEVGVYAGPHGYKGPLDQGRNGNFGFHEGVNFGAPLMPGHQIGYQIGAEFNQSNLSGDRVVGADDSVRDQTFLTAGIFHRAWCGQGLQWGVVYDWLDDNYYTHTNLSQIRAEISWISCCGNEIGFWGTFSTEDDETPVPVDSTGQAIVIFEPTDMYTLFFRKNLSSGGQGRIWGGGTEHGDGIVGADFRVPLSNRFDLTGIFNYLIPEEGSSGDGAIEESWGLAMNLVWYPFRRPEGVHNGPYRPLMNVASNPTFFIDRLQ